MDRATKHQVTDCKQRAKSIFYLFLEYSSKNLQAAVIQEPPSWSLWCLSTQVPRCLTVNNQPLNRERFFFSFSKFYYFLKRSLKFDCNCCFYLFASSRVFTVRCRPVGLFSHTLTHTHRCTCRRLKRGRRRRRRRRRGKQLLRLWDSLSCWQIADLPLGVWGVRARLMIEKWTSLSRALGTFCAWPVHYLTGGFTLSLFYFNYLQTSSVKCR